MSFNIHPTQGCFYLKMLLFCYGHPCIYESFCCHMLICTIIVFDIANYCMSSDGKRLSSLKKNYKQTITVVIPKPWGTCSFQTQWSKCFFQSPPSIPCSFHLLSQGRMLQEGILGKILPELQLSDALCRTLSLIYFFCITSRQCMESFFSRSFFILVPRFRHALSLVISKSK